MSFVLVFTCVRGGGGGRRRRGGCFFDKVRKGGRGEGDIFRFLLDFDNHDSHS